MSINKNAEKLPYYEKARDILNYNPQTGVFTRFVKSRSISKEAGTTKSSGYREISISINNKEKKIKLHRLAWFIYYGELPNVIDHINNVKNDNKISNLRSCTQAQNLLNQKKRSTNTSGYKGVSWEIAKNKWKATVRYNGKSIFLGYFNCPKEASEVYEAKAKELYGEYYNGIN